jgi:hypothetical protein
MINTISSMGVLALNTWATVVCRYDASTRNNEIYVNGALVGRQLGGNPIANKAMSNTYVAFGNIGSISYWNGDIAGMFVVDELLSLSVATEIATSMSNGVDMTSMICPSGQNCTQCNVGTYKTTTGSDTCTACPAGKTSPIGSTSSTACVAVCNAGYTGGTCTACVAGKYKTTTGSVTCIDCDVGLYSVATGASTASVCINCGAGTDSTDVGASACVQCVAGKYKGSGSGACIQCVSGTASAVPGATSLSSCIDCGVGKYSALDSASCAACPGNSSAPARSSSFTACVCNIGYQGGVA